MGLAGFVGFPADSCEEVLERANYASTKRGGEGAVRDIIEKLFKAAGFWNSAVKEV